MLAHFTLSLKCWTCIISLAFILHQDASSTEILGQMYSIIDKYLQLGMGSALETLCGQAYGAGQIRMLGVYMQRSWVILLTTAVVLLPIYIFASPILTLFGETPEISRAAGPILLLSCPNQNVSSHVLILHV